MDQPFNREDLEKRRSASRRLGWLIAAAALLLYLAGLFIKR